MNRIDSIRIANRNDLVRRLKPNDNRSSVIIPIIKYRNSDMFGIFNSMDGVTGCSEVKFVCDGPDGHLVNSE